MSLYLGHGSQRRQVLVGKMAAGQVLTSIRAASDLRKHGIVPVNDGVVCDVDVFTLARWDERVLLPHLHGETVAIVDPTDGEVSPISEDFNRTGPDPWMLTADAQGRLWVQMGSKYQ